MDLGKQSYSRAGAKKLMSEISSSITLIKTALDGVEAEVGSLRKWWVGYSSDEFIKACNTMRAKVEYTLDMWLKLHEDLVEEITHDKFTKDHNLGNRMGVR